MFYSLGESIFLSLCTIYTKVFWKKARLVKLPCRARNKRNIIYQNSTFGYSCRITAGEVNKVILGNTFSMGDYCQLEGAGGITIGSNVLMGSRVSIITTSHGQYNKENSSSPLIPPLKREIYTRSVCIGDNVWIGNEVVILPGVTIGDGAVIGAGSIVTKSVEANCIVAGNPASVIKRYNNEIQEWQSL